MNNKLEHLQKWLENIETRITVRNALYHKKPILHLFVFELDGMQIGRRCNFREAKALCVGITYSKKEMYQ
jgi:hypothetical protein